MRFEVSNWNHMTLCLRTFKFIVYLLLIWPFNPPSKRSYPLRCQLYDQDIDRDRFCQMKDPSHNTKTQAFCGLWVVVMCPRDSIVMGSTIDCWVDVFATITVYFWCAWRFFCLYYLLFSTMTCTYQINVLCF